MLQVYLKDDMIVREGEVAREMYFVKSGAVQVCTHRAAVQPGSSDLCVIQHAGPRVHTRGAYLHMASQHCRIECRMLRALRRSRWAACQSQS